MTTISWTNETWNPIVGCSRISEGCRYCYAADAAKSARLQQFPQYQKVKDWNGTIEFVESQLLKPLSWRSPKKIFVCSMSDLFHNSVPFAWVDKVFAIIAKTPQHTYQILTKRPERMHEYFTYYLAEAIPLPNVWLGVSVENQKAANDRIPFLLQTPAAIRFLSCEPLLESVDLSAYLPIEWSELAEDWIDSWPGVQAYEQKLHWVIAGGESGSKSRECHINWLRSLVHQCQKAKVPVFVKQLGSNAIVSNNYIDGVAKTHHKIKLKNRKGGDITEFPEDLRVRQFPQ